MKIFYSWQSDEKSTRNLIEQSIKGAMEVIPFELETATRDAVGSPDISASILRKIDESDLFLADVTIINSESDSRRKTPNPNVLYELGYALKSRGENNLILIANKDLTKDAELPFDIRNRRIVLLPFSNKDAKKKIMKAIGASVTNYTPSSTGSDTPILSMVGSVVDWANWGVDGKTRAGFRLRISIDNYEGRSDYLMSAKLIIVTADKREIKFDNFFVIQDRKVVYPFPIAPDEVLEFPVVFTQDKSTNQKPMPKFKVERAYVEIKLRSGKVSVIDIEPYNILPHNT